MNLIQLYYAFNLEYPEIYTGALGILQEHMMRVGEYVLYKSSGYKHFAANLRKAVKSIEKRQKAESQKDDSSTQGSPLIDNWIK